MTSEERTGRTPYFWLGTGLAIAGAILSPVFYFVVGSDALSALGISFVMLGLTAVALASTRPPISPEASQMMLQAGIENTAALLEELGLTGQATYFPSSEGNGRSRAVVPLRPGQLPGASSRPIGGRLIVRHGPGPQDMGIAVTTPGSVCIEALEARPGADPGEIEAALSHLLIGVLDMASAVSVSASPGRVKVETARPKLGHENVWYYRSLGSPMASIAATVICEAYGAPVRVVREEQQEGKGTIELEVLP